MDGRGETKNNSFTFISKIKLAAKSLNETKTIYTHSYPPRTFPAHFIGHLRRRWYLVYGVSDSLAGAHALSHCMLAGPEIKSGSKFKSWEDIKYLMHCPGLLVIVYVWICEGNTANEWTHVRSITTSPKQDTG